MTNRATIGSAQTSQASIIHPLVISRSDSTIRERLVAKATECGATILDLYAAQRASYDALQQGLSFELSYQCGLSELERRVEQ